MQNNITHTNNSHLAQTVRVIKKYQNRKLYDLKMSGYVTLEDIGRMVKCNEEVKVIDNKSKTDITAAVLMQIAFERGMKKSEYPPVPALREIISSSGNISNFLLKKGLFTEEQMVKMEKTTKCTDSVRSESKPHFEDNSPIANTEKQILFQNQNSNNLKDLNSEMDLLPKGSFSQFNWE